MSAVQTWSTHKVHIVLTHVPNSQLYPPPRDRSPCVDWIFQATLVQTLVSPDATNRKTRTEALCGMSDMPTHRAADSGLVCPYLVCTPTWWSMVMLTTGRAFIGARSLLFLSVGSGAVHPQPRPLHPSRLPECEREREREKTRDQGSSLVSSHWRWNPATSYSFPRTLADLVRPPGRGPGVGVGWRTSRQVYWQDRMPEVTFTGLT